MAVTGRVTRDSAVDWFRECFRSSPEGVWFAPGRVNFLGEHTDYNEGWVLPFAIEEGTVAAAARSGDGMLTVWSRQAGGGPVSVALDSLRPGSVDGWGAYLGGVAWALREAGYVVGGADIAIDSDLPTGSGLSSSAAVECAVGLALAGVYGIDVPRGELVLACSRAENEMVGVPSGILDQSASLLCEAGYALLLDCRSRQSDLVPFDMAAAGLTLAVIDTHAQHAHAGGGYVQRRRECDEAARQLGVTCLREVDDVAALRRLDDPVLVRRAWHVITENERVLTAVSLLRAGDMRATGELLFASHESLAKDFEVSWPEADAAVAAARGAGAYGARMVGGGFGGSVVALMPANDGKVPAAIREEFAGHGWQAPGFLPAQPSAGARCLR